MKVAWSRDSNPVSVNQWENTYKKLVSLRGVLEASDYWYFLRRLDTARQAILDGKHNYATISVMASIEENLEKANK